MFLSNSRIIQFSSNTLPKFWPKPNRLHAGKCHYLDIWHQKCDILVIHSIRHTESICDNSVTPFGSSLKLKSPVRGPWMVRFWMSTVLQKFKRSRRFLKFNNRQLLTPRPARCSFYIHSIFVLPKDWVATPE